MVSSTQKRGISRPLKEKRKNISIACDNCKRSKLKCTGTEVCSLCLKKNIKCEYTGVDKRTLRGSKNYIGNSQPISYTDGSATIDSTIHASDHSESENHISYGEERTTGSNVSDSTKDTSDILTYTNDDGDWIRSSSYTTADANINCLNNFDKYPLNSYKENENDLKISYQEGKCSFLIPDSMGTLRYIGESSPYSLLYETRTFFLRVKGPTNFTNILKKCPIEDRPLNPDKVAVGLPSRDIVDIYIDNFVKNINNTFYILDIDEFKANTLEKVFNGIYVNNPDMALLYLILAVGSTCVVDRSSITDINTDIMYLNKGNIILQDNLINDGLWIAQAYLLNHFFYQHIGKCSTSWINLGIAIKYAQAFGIHRTFINEQFSSQEESIIKKKLFRTLYICDRISSVFLGRPLTINDYDYNDYKVYNEINDFNDKCQHEISKLCYIISKVIENFYSDNYINVDKTRNLAIELKLWSVHLPQELKIDRILQWNNNCDVFLNSWTKYNLLLIHLLQLFAIMLLSRPFFMYELSSHVNPNITISSNDRNMTNQLYNASVKAAILSIRLIYHYLKSDSTRMESHVLIQCCGYASFILGLKLLDNNEGVQSYEETKDVIKTAMFILKIYSPYSTSASRFCEVIARMIDALSEVNKEDMSSLSVSFDVSDGQLFPSNFSPTSFTDINFVTDPNNNLETLMDFQQYFVSKSFAPIKVIPHISKEDMTNSSYVNDSYSLFLGDKC